MGGSGRHNNYAGDGKNWIGVACIYHSYEVSAILLDTYVIIIVSLNGSIKEIC